MADNSKRLEVCFLGSRPTIEFMESILAAIEKTRENEGGLMDLGEDREDIQRKFRFGQYVLFMIQTKQCKVADILIPVFQKGDQQSTIQKVIHYLKFYSKLPFIFIFLMGYTEGESEKMKGEFKKAFSDLPNHAFITTYNQQNSPIDNANPFDNLYAIKLQQLHIQ